MEQSEKVGLGFQSDEAVYEKNLCEEIEGLILGGNRLESEKLGDFEVGFDQKDVIECFNGKKDVGFGENGEKVGFVGRKDVGFGEKGKKEGFDGKNDVGFDKNDEGFGEKGKKEDFDGKNDVGFGEKGIKEENNNDVGLNGNMGYEKEYGWGDDDDVGYDKKEVRESFYGDVSFDKEDVKEGFNGDWGFDEDERKGFVGDISFDKRNVKDGFNGGNNSYPSREEFYDDVGFGGVRKGFNGGENSWGNNGNSSYPVRPDAEDCQYYMRYGSCKFGPSCKFNHPLKRRNQYPKAAMDKEDYSERPGKVECKYNMTSGGCKYGTACKFNHSRGNFSATPAVEFNFLGLPIRLGETECPYYMRTGSCKYGSNCRFNHPQPTTEGLNPPSRYVNGGAVSSYAKPQTNMPSWSSHNAVNGSGSVSPYSPTNGVPNPNLEWNSYQAPGYPATERRLPIPPAFALNNHTETNFYTNSQMPMIVDDFPERPGEPECSYFIKTGDCKYRSGCKFHHPKNRTPSAASCALSDKGLPLRPDQQVCTYYTRYGLCKFGPACRYDHPANYDNSASSPLSGQNTPRPVAARW